MRAVHEGVVAFAGQFTGYGNLVIVEHGVRAFSRTGISNRCRWLKGSELTRSRRSGAAATPNGTPAFYFELRVDGKPVDPTMAAERDP